MCFIVYKLYDQKNNCVLLKFKFLDETIEIYTFDEIPLKEYVEDLGFPSNPGDRLLEKFCADFPNGLSNEIKEEILDFHLNKMDLYGDSDEYIIEKPNLLFEVYGVRTHKSNEIKNWDIFEVLDNREINNLTKTSCFDRRYMSDSELKSTIQGPNLKHILSEHVNDVLSMTLGSTLTLKFRPMGCEDLVHVKRVG